MVRQCYKPFHAHYDGKYVLSSASGEMKSCVHWPSLRGQFFQDGLHTTTTRGHVQHPCWHKPRHMVPSANPIHKRQQGGTMSWQDGNSGRLWPHHTTPHHTAHGHAANTPLSPHACMQVHHTATPHSYTTQLGGKPIPRMQAGRLQRRRMHAQRGGTKKHTAHRSPPSS